MNLTTYTLGQLQTARTMRRLLLKAIRLDSLKPCPGPGFFLRLPRQFSKICLQDQGRPLSLTCFLF